MEIRQGILVRAPAARVWRVLGEEFMAVGRWAGPITSSCAVEGDAVRVGAVRACTIERLGPFGAGEIHERLLEVDREGMSLTYEAARGMPGFVAGARNRWCVVALDEGSCRVETRASVELTGPMALAGCLVRWQLQRAGASVLEELRHYVETGEPHARKLAKLRALVATRPPASGARS